jgi:hypothetical protein
VRIDEIEQDGTDFDWFAVDEEGSVAHFATVGFKRLPATISCSAEDLTVVTDYFLNRAPVVSEHQINQDIGRNRDDWKGEAAEGRYLKSFVEMADRGLYSYDIETYVNPATAYFCVAVPTRPVSIEHLPENVRIILKRTVLKGLSLKAIPKIDYEPSLRY